MLSFQENLCCILHSFGPQTLKQDFPKKSSQSILSLNDAVISYKNQKNFMGGMISHKIPKLHFEHILCPSWPINCKRKILLKKSISIFYAAVTECKNSERSMHWLFLNLKNFIFGSFRNHFYLKTSKQDFSQKDHLNQDFFC